MQHGDPFRMECVCVFCARSFGDPESCTSFKAWEGVIRDHIAFDHSRTLESRAELNRLVKISYLTKG